MRRVAVVGGGLGGMAAALTLARQGQLQVTLFEARNRLGGMAGASRIDGAFEDHGYHIFPPWYENIYQILEDLKLRDRLKDVEKFQQLKAGAYPVFRQLTNLTSMRHAWTNLWSGAHPFLDMALFYYSVIDLICQPPRLRGFLDQVSVYGFVRYRFYRTDTVANLYQDLLLKFLSVPSYKLSAMAVRTMLSYWVVQGVPTCRILPGDMETTFIGPWRQELERLRCRVVTGARLTGLRLDSGRVVGLELAGNGSPRTAVEGIDDVVLALPPIALAALNSDDLHRAAPELSKLHYLNAEAMGSLSLHMREKLGDLPAEHINLLGSRFALTLIDVSQHWPNCEHTVLNVIASDMNELEGVSDALAAAEIVQELRRYLPFVTPDKVARAYFQPHFAEPLVMNDVGAWHFRPGARTGIPNLYLAGTHCRSHIDMTSMEGAVVTGLLAANELIASNGLLGAYRIKQPEAARRWAFLLLRLVAFPLALLGKAWILLRQAF